MIHLLWIVPLFLLFWAIVYVGDCDPDWYDDHSGHNASDLTQEE